MRKINHVFDDSRKEQEKLEEEAKEKGEVVEFDPDKGITLMVTAAKHAISDQVEALKDDPKNEAAEELLDTDTIYKILDVCAGLKFDPKDQETQRELAMMIAKQATEKGS